MNRKIIGLTGSIGMGKTYILNIFANKNIPIFDSDYEIGKLYNDKQIIRKLSNLSLNIVKDEFIDKIELNKYIINNRNNLKKLESIFYPKLNIIINRFIQKNHDSDIIIFDIPLLFEKNYHHKYNFDNIITVDVAKFIQKKRVMSRENIDYDKFKFILSNQYNNSKKIYRSDFVIYTGRRKADCVIQINNILNIIRGDFCEK